MNGTEGMLFGIFIILYIFTQVLGDSKMYLMTNNREIEAAFVGALASFINLSSSSLTIGLGVSSGAGGIIFIYAGLMALISYSGTILTSKIFSKEKNKNNKISFFNKRKLNKKG